MLDKTVKVNEQDKKSYVVQNSLNENDEFEYQTNPVKAIRDKCKYDCCAGDTESWKNCPNKFCMLYPFRLGRNPFRTKREYTEEELEELRTRLNSNKG